MTNAAVVGLIVFILHAERDLARGQTVEQQIDFIAKAEVLRALADIEEELRFALSRVPAVELDDAVFEFESAQLFLERLGVEHRRSSQVRAGRAAPPCAGESTCPNRRSTRRPRRAIAPFGLTACSSAVTPASFCTLTRKLANPAPPVRAWPDRRDLHPRLGVDVDAAKAVLIQDLLHLSSRTVARCLQRLRQRFFIGRAQRGAQEFQRFLESANARRQRLPFHIAHDR